MIRTLFGHLKSILALAPVAVSATGTSSTIDMQGFGACMFQILAGAFAFSGANKITIAVQESADGTTFTQVADADMLAVEATGIHRVLDGTEDSGSLTALHYRGNKRYLQVKYTVGGTVSVPLSIVAVKGHPELKPPL